MIEQYGQGIGVYMGGGTVDQLFIPLTGAGVARAFMGTGGEVYLGGAFGKINHIKCTYTFFITYLRLCILLKPK
jgi:hypothetical protein